MKSTDFPMDSESEFIDETPQDLNADEFEKIADYVRIKKSVRGIGVLSMFLGAIAAMMMVMIMTDRFRSAAERAWDTAGIVVCCFHLIGGLWLIVSPSRFILRIIILLMAVEVVGLWVGALHDGALLIPGLLPTLAVLWIYFTYRRSHILCDAPQADSLHAMKTLLRRIKTTDVTKHPQFIEFRSSRHLIHSNTWKAQLDHTHGLFLNVHGHYFQNLNKPDVLLVGKDDVEIAKRGRYLFRKKYKIDVRIRDYTTRGSIQQESLERYEHWKQSDS